MSVWYELGRRRALGFFVAAALFAGLGVWANDSIRDRNDRFERTAQVTGADVLATTDGGKNSDSIEVHYTAGGHDRIGRIEVRESSHYRVGERIEVLYDPANPGDIRTRRDPNASTVTTGLLITSIFGGVGSFIAGVKSALWTRRSRHRRRACKIEPERA